LTLRRRLIILWALVNTKRNLLGSVDNQYPKGGATHIVQPHLKGVPEQAQDDHLPGA
jgi:hypothetical protein